MQEYLGALIGVSLLGGLVRMLSPEGELQKYLRLAIGLCLVCAMLQPMLSLLSSEEGFFREEWFEGREEFAQNYDEIYNQSLQNGAMDQAENVVRAEIYREFSLNEESAEISTVFLSENETLSLSEVRIFLRGEGVLIDPRALTEFVRAEWDCDCTVGYE